MANYPRTLHDNPFSPRPLLRLRRGKTKSADSLRTQEALWLSLGRFKREQSESDAHPDLEGVVLGLPGIREEGMPSVAAGEGWAVMPGYRARPGTRDAYIPGGLLTRITAFLACLSSCEHVGGDAPAGLSCSVTTMWPFCSHTMWWKQTKTPAEKSVISKGNPRLPQPPTGTTAQFFERSAVSRCFPTCISCPPTRQPGRVRGRPQSLMCTGIQTFTNAWPPGRLGPWQQGITSFKADCRLDNSKSLKR